MPLHDFRCQNCQAEFEMLVRAGSPRECKSCGGSDLEQLPSGFGMSSSGLRQAAVAKARASADKARAGRRHDDHTYMKKHLEDH